VRNYLLGIYDPSGYAVLLRVRWYPVIKNCLDCYDPEKKVFLHLPGTGGLYDQDEYLLSVWNCIVKNYEEALKDEDFLKVIRARNGKNRPDNKCER
jgi:hypothetical protein